MSAPLTAIPTEFRGVKMRSRFEANVAYMLDLFGIEWRYEPQSFLLGEAGHYWPDFELPELHTWLECRGYAGRDEQLDAFAERCIGASERFVIVRSEGPAEIVGPWGEGYRAAMRVCLSCRLWHFDSDESTHECPACGHVLPKGTEGVCVSVSAVRGRMPLTSVIKAILDASALSDWGAVHRIVNACYNGPATIRSLPSRIDAIAEAFIGAILDCPALLDDAELIGLSGTLTGDHAVAWATFKAEGIQPDVSPRVPESLHIFVAERFANPWKLCQEDARWEAVMNGRKLKGFRLLDESNEQVRLVSQYEAAGDIESVNRTMAAIVANARERRALGAR